MTAQAATVASVGASVSFEPTLAAWSTMKVSAAGMPSARMLVYRTASASSTGVGGAFYLKHTTATMTRASFTSSSSPDGGGTGYVEDISTLTMTDLSISDSKTYTNGGALYVASSDVMMKNFAISGTTTTSGYGGVYLSSSTGTFENGTFTSNWADMCGAAIYNSGSTVTATGAIEPTTGAIVAAAIFGAVAAIELSIGVSMLVSDYLHRAAMRREIEEITQAAAQQSKADKV